MRSFSLVQYAVAHPRATLLVIAALPLLSLVPLPRIRTDTNPKNTLPPTSPVRVGNAAVEKTFGPHEDMIVVGIQNDAGILNPTTLEKVRRITRAILEIPGVAARDVTSFLTVTNVSAEEDLLRVGPLMPEPPPDACGARLAAPGAVRQPALPQPHHLARRQDHRDLRAPRDGCQLTQQLWNQTLTGSLFVFWGVTERDGHLIPSARHAATDSVWIEVGGNLFVGGAPRTMFGALDRNDNVYATVRYSV